MRKLIFAAAALAVIGFSGCQKDNAGTENGGNGAPGVKTRMTLSFALPTSFGTKATDGGELQGTTEESTVTSADVFVFEANGQPAQVGAYNRYNDMTGFTSTVVSGNNVYTLDSPYIETLSGAKLVYVGVNIPSTVFAGFTGNEADMLAKVADIEDMSVDNAFTMFSDGEAVTLVADDASTTDIEGIETGTENVVNLDVRRVVSKVATSTAAATYTNDWTDANAPLELVYTIKDFRVFQHTLSSFVAPNYWSTNGPEKTQPGVAPTPINDEAGVDVFSDFADDKDATAVAIGLNPTQSDDAAIVAMDGYYIGENYPVDANNQPMALNANSTYVMVATTVTASMYATWVDEDSSDADPATNPTVGHVEWVDAITPYGGGVDSIWMINALDGDQYITNSAANADAVARGLGLSSTDLSTPAGAGIYLYEKGYVHFQVFLNHEDINDYALLRNQFVHVKINDIIAQDFLFPGNYGEPGDPSKPVIPTDPALPDPLVPTDPVDGAPAYLDVVVTVMPWTYKENAVTLQ